jgi:hypothetical protein
MPTGTEEERAERTMKREEIRGKLRLIPQRKREMKEEYRNITQSVKKLYQRYFAILVTLSRMDIIFCNFIRNEFARKNVTALYTVSPHQIAGFNRDLELWKHVSFNNKVYIEL